MKNIERQTDTILRYLDLITKELANSRYSTLKNGRSQKTIAQNVLQWYRLDTLNQKLNTYQDKTVNSLEDLLSRKYFTEPTSRPWNDRTVINKKISTSGLNALLTAFKNRIALNEYGITNALRREGSGCILHFDEMTAIAVPTTGGRVPGRKVKAMILIAEYNKAINPTIICNKGSVIRTENGIATWERKRSPLGNNTVSGVVSINLKDSSTRSRPFTFNYMVVAPGISMQGAKMNTCYAGVDNPISISVPGFGDARLSLRVKGARVSKISHGHFNIYFDRAPKDGVYAFVDAVNEEGEKGAVASMYITVRQLPAPIATLRGAEDGSIRLGDFKRARGLSAMLVNSDFDMSYRIVSYKLSLLHRHNTVYVEPVKGMGAFSNNEAVLMILDIARRGDRAIFEDIIVKDANGRIIELAPLMLTLY